MTAHTSDCDRKRIDAFLDAGRVGVDDALLIEHLDNCRPCREYMERQAASVESWGDAADMLRSGEFDRASSPECSAATLDFQAANRPLAIQSILDSLAPSEDPRRLGRLGGHEISGVVGAGSMGVVLKAIDPSLDRVVAVKVMAPHLANHTIARKRFAREAKAAAAVLHPNVIPIHCVSSDEKIPYLVMAYIRGGSLQKRLESQGPLPPIEILRIGAQIAAGLAAAHEQGLVHRDIKPENILLEEGVERVTLTDFGLARAVDDASVTVQGTIAGTPRYMSPEQARGEVVDQMSDLFSLGSVLYSLCTGRSPFRGETSYAVMRNISDETPTAIRHLNPEIPDWLCGIIEKLMAKEKSERFESVQEVQKLLEACLHHAQQPTTVPLPANLPAARKAGRETEPRIKRAYAICAILAVTLILCIAASGMLELLNLDRFFHSSGQAVEAAKVVREYFQGESETPPDRALGTLLRSQFGREHLLELDRQLPLVAYIEGKFADGKDRLLFFVCQGRNGSLVNVVGCRGYYKSEFDSNFPLAISIESARFKEQPAGMTVLVITYKTSSDATHAFFVEDQLRLELDTTYTLEITASNLAQQRVHWQEVWQRGTPHAKRTTPPNLATQDKHDSKVARVRPLKDIKTLEKALDDFEQDNGHYPKTESGWRALVGSAAESGKGNWQGPYLNHLPTDPWGNVFGYEYPDTRAESTDKPRIWSWGPDGLDNTGDDIGNWRMDANDPDLFRRRKSLQEQSASELISAVERLGEILDQVQDRETAEAAAQEMKELSAQIQENLDVVTGRKPMPFPLPKPTLNTCLDVKQCLKSIDQKTSKLVRQDTGKAEDVLETLKHIRAIANTDETLNELSIADAFMQIKTGMLRVDVEAFLGRPLLERGDAVKIQAVYIQHSERTTPLRGSPWGYGAVHVTYDAKNRVVTKTLNPDYVEDADYQRANRKPVADANK